MKPSLFVLRLSINLTSGEPFCNERTARAKTANHYKGNAPKKGRGKNAKNAKEKIEILFSLHSKYINSYIYILLIKYFFSLLEI